MTDDRPTVDAALAKWREEALDGASISLAHCRTAIEHWESGTLSHGEMLQYLGAATVALGSFIHYELTEGIAP